MGAAKIQAKDLVRTRRLGYAMSMLKIEETSGS